MAWFKKQHTGKVFVGLSGGVDSAVSAALLKQQGYDVTGVFIKIQIPGYPCPAAVDRVEAMRVAAHLRIPFIEIDLSQNYTDEVFKNAVDEFALGRTPNPDALCNKEIKFGAFYNFAMAHGADFVATGHYAQTKQPRKIRGKNGLAREAQSRYGKPEDLFAANFSELFVSVDSTKDQSYFLWAVPQEHLAKTLFPVGGMHKKQVRRLAKKFGLPNAVRKDSQGLCFLGDISLDDMIEKEIAPTPGKVLSEDGEVIGEHRGVEFYTLGERHGFVLTVSGTNMQPHFVIAKDSKENTITVSTNRFPRTATKTEVFLKDVNWIGDVETGKVEVRYRYRQTLVPATLLQKEGAVKVVFDAPHYVPLGQSLVLYQGEHCLGGGVVDKSEPR